MLAVFQRVLFYNMPRGRSPRWFSQWVPSKPDILTPTCCGFGRSLVKSHEQELFSQQVESSHFVSFALYTDFDG